MITLVLVLRHSIEKRSKHINDQLVSNHRNPRSTYPYLEVYVRVVHVVLAECIVEFNVGGYDHRNGGAYR